MLLSDETRETASGERMRLDDCGFVLFEDSMNEPRLRCQFLKDPEF